jgi:eukaryotic-like serine/threonine-protein kinase
MTTLGASKPADEAGDERGRGAAFVPHFWPEQGLSRYSLGPLIAMSGGSMVRFGVVAGGAQFARLLAIKQLNPVVSRQPSHVFRFKEEMRIHARVRHPNVVELLDVVESSGESWLVMEHIEGATLATLLSHRRACGRPLEPELAAGIIAPLLRGLHAVHETKDDAGLPLSIVHGGVSPRHVMVDRDGQVKLLDFGMARAVGEPPSLTPRRAPGRFGHLSPELVLGEKVDRRSDLFAVGILLWESLAGRSLFEEGGVSDADGLRRVIKAPIPELRDVRAGTPKALCAVVHKALQRDPERRFATAEELALALEAAITPASPSRLAALVAELGEAHFEPTRQALAAVRRSLPAPLTKPTFSEEFDDGEEPTMLMTGQFTHGDTLSPASAEVSRPAPRRAAAPARKPLPLALIALVAAALAASLVVAVRRHASTPLAQVAAAPPSLPAEPASEPEATLPEPEPEPEPAPRLAEPIPVDALPLSSEAASPTAPSKANAAPRRLHRRVGYSRAAFQPRAAARAASCSPPTFLGEDGIRHFKDHCI